MCRDPISLILLLWFLGCKDPCSRSCCCRHKCRCR